MMNLKTDSEDLLKSSLVPGVPCSAHYIPDFITKTDENEIISKVNSAPIPKWTQLSNRRLQNWGGLPHKKGMIAETIPKWLETEIAKVSLLGAFSQDKIPNHVLINEYLPGQGIMAHTDGLLFHPVVATISCGSHTLLQFYKRSSTDNIEQPNREFSLLLEPRSLLILQKDLYINYLHAIDERKLDTVSINDVKNLQMCSRTYEENEILERSTRISLTIRHVLKTTKLKLNFGKSK